MTPASPPGWFGKIPNLGDFVTRRLPDGFVRPWDDWLQHGLALMRRRTGLLEDDGVKPAICRFWIGPGVVDGHAWTGVLSSSADRVGRRFPLTIAAQIDRETAPDDSLGAALAARAWFAALDGIVERSRDAQFGTDAMEAALAALAPERAATVDSALATALLHHCSPAGDAEATLPPRSRSLPATNSGSIWWHQAARKRDDYMPFAHLPPPEALPMLLGPPAEPGYRS